jgi:hypothetical protein
MSSRIAGTVEVTHHDRVETWMERVDALPGKPQT